MVRDAMKLSAIADYSKNMLPWRLLHSVEMIRVMTRLRVIGRK